MAVAEAPQRVDLTTLVADPDPIRRRWAVERLGDTGDNQAFMLLLKSLEDEDSAVRQAVLAALGQYGRVAIEPVNALLDREQVPQVRAAALQLLDQLRGD
jgi:HEAT repeat protein